MRPSNPFHIYPMYPIDAAASKVTPYQTPTRSSMPFQFRAGAALTVSGFAFVSIDGTVSAQDTADIEIDSLSVGGRFFTYQGGVLSSPLSNGLLYRPRVTLSNGSIYWGHLLCANAAFDTDLPLLSINSCVPPLITIGITSVQGASTGTVVIDENGTLTQSFGGTSVPLALGSFTLDGDEVSILLTTTQTIATPNGGTRSSTVVYRYTAKIGNPCGTGALVLVSETSTSQDGIFELTTWNSTDVQTKNILYQNGFKQKLWFTGVENNPVPLTVENYLENGQSDTFFQSARQAEQRRIEFFPCPDQAALGLVYARQDSHATISGAGSSNLALYRLGFEAIEVEQSHVLAGRILAEFTGAFTQAFMNDFVLGETG